MTIKILLIILGLFALSQIIFRIIGRLFHFPVPAFIGPILDSNYRRRLQPPSKLIKRSGIKEGMRVLEVGCGSGAFTTFVAEHVSENGKIFALDIQLKMLEQLKSKSIHPTYENLKNIELINGSAHNLPFDNSSIDLAYMVTVLQEIHDQKKALLEIKRVLKPRGILAVTEFLPDPDYPLKSTTIRMGKDVGFILDKKSGNFWNYTVRFRKA